MRNLSRLLLILPALSACSTKRSIGDHPLDQTLLSASPPTAHLVAAIEGGETATPADVLLERATIIAAPNPSAYLESQRAPAPPTPPPMDVVNPGPDAPAEGAEPLPPPPPAELPTPQLKVLSYNTGLLDRKYPSGHVQMPEMPARFAVMPERLLTDGWDVLLLQEVWENEAVDTLRAAAETHGYVVYAGTDKHHVQHGLVMIVKKSVIGPGDFVQEEHQFRDQRRIERFPGPNIKRGWLEWELTLATGQRVRLYNTHAQSFAGFWPVRERQYRELGLDVAEIPSDVSVIVGGDFNAGWYYPHDKLGLDDGELVGDWWVNATGIPLFVHYSGLSDAHVVVGLAQDVARMDALPPFDAAWAENPNGGTCESMPVDTFTATDCNSMYRHSYAAQEYPARLDYLFYRPGALVPVSGEIAYTARDVPDDDRMIELSDHYGAAVTFSLR